MDFNHTEGSRGQVLETHIDWDLRFFRRYQKESHFTLTVKDRSFTARIVDYSLIGVGIIIDEVTVPLAQGDYIFLNIDELELHEKGRIAWMRKTSSGIRVGIEKTGRFRGYFRLYPLPDILIGFQRTLKTGALNVSYGSIDKKVYIRNGQVISAASNYEKDRLGDVLLKSRRINRKQYDKAAEMHRKSGADYTDILLHMGYLKLPDVIRAVELQTRRIIGSLLTRKEAGFEFVEGLPPSDDALTLDLSVSDLIYWAVKKNADVELLDHYLLDSFVDFSSNPLNLFQNIRFTAADKVVLSYVDGKTSIRDIVQRSTIGRANPLKVIYALLEARFLKIKEKGDAPRVIQQKKRLGGNAKGKVKGSAEIERIYSEYKALDYYGILGLERNATADEIKKAYYSIGTKYHPDMHFQAPADVKKKLIEIFTLVTNACLTLTDPVKRKEYDSDIERRDAPDNEPSKEQSGMLAVQGHVEQKEDKIPRSIGTRFDENADIARLRFSDGKFAFWNKNFREAAQLFAKAISYDRSVPEYHYFYGCALGKTEKLKEAASALLRADELKPRNPDFLAELGHVYLKLGFPLRAKGYFHRALRLDPLNDRAKKGINMLKT